MKMYTLEKDKYYRNCLGNNIGKDVILTCNDFEFITRSDGKTFLLLKNPQITKIRNKRGHQKYPITLNHLWVKVDKDFKKQIPVARKLQINGVIKEYPYLNKQTKQVGVTATNVQILKYKKEIAKKFKLSPGQKLNII